MAKQEVMFRRVFAVIDRDTGGIYSSSDGPLVFDNEIKAREHLPRILDQQNAIVVMAAVRWPFNKIAKNVEPAKLRSDLAPDSPLRELLS